MSDRSVLAPQDVVAVPANEDMAEEPAETIATAFQVKTAIVAVLAILGVSLSPELDTNVDVLIQTGVMVAFGVYQLWSAWKQGRETRAAVYSPESAAKLARSDSVRVIRDSPEKAVIG